MCCIMHAVSIFIFRAVLVTVGSFITLKLGVYSVLLQQDTGKTLILAHKTLAFNYY